MLGFQTPVAAIALPPKARQVTPIAAIREPREPTMRRPRLCLEPSICAAALVVSMRSSSGSAASCSLLLMVRPFSFMVLPSLTGGQQNGPQARQPSTDALAHHLLRAAKLCRDLLVVAFLEHAGDDGVAKIVWKVAEQLLDRQVEA